MSLEELSSPAYLTKEEAASLARCSPRTIQRAVHSGALRAFRPGTRVLLLEADVRGWVESELASATERPRPRSSRRRSKPGSVSAIRELDPQAR